MNTEQEDDYVLDETLSEPYVCKRFGCGKELTRSEYLASNYCTECSQKKINTHTLLLKDKFNDTYFDTIILK